MFKYIHHIAIICTDYERSKQFYTEVLELEIIRETYREDRQSFKLDLSLNEEYVIELFSFPNPEIRSSRPEAAGLRHLAFAVDDLDNTILKLEEKGVIVENIRVDLTTQKRYTFFEDPDQLPIELYEA